MRPPHQLLEKFEQGLNVNNLKQSTIPANLIGYGEISSIFSIINYEDWVVKRMPVFSSYEQAEEYKNNFITYCNLLSSAGINIPPYEVDIIKHSEDLYCFYNLQQKFDSHTFVHNIIHTHPTEITGKIFRKILGELKKIKQFNYEMNGKHELAIDSQLSNWVYYNNELYFIDTSTPLYRQEDNETMDPELFLKSAPAPFRFLIRKFFLADVMNRYYDFRMQIIDLIANLHKEKKKNLINIFVDIANESSLINDTIDELEIHKYYQEDKRIWSIFLFARRIDRWMNLYIFRNEYHFILPGKISR